MGFWKSERGINGDGWADEMGRCMKALEKMTIPSKDPLIKDHEITMGEFADLVEFCSRGHLVVDVRNSKSDGGRPLSELFNSWGIETHPNRGQTHCPELATV